ncbi:MAG: hypothetical protein AAF658_20680, partial [Myxococcota bacterium]
ASDPVDIVAFEVSSTGLESDYVEIPLVQGLSGHFPSGALAGLATSPAGEPHALTWNSALTFPGQDIPLGAIIRIRVQDSQRSTSDPATSAAFAIDNGETPPVILVDPVEFPADVTQPLRMTYSILDADESLSLVLVDYTLDLESETWVAAASNDRTVELSPGTTYSFTWDIFQVPAGLYDSVYLRFTPSDGTNGIPVRVGPFRLDTRTGGSIDASAPDYVSPLPGRIYGVEESIELQWTSRLGASLYEIEVTTEIDDEGDPDFSSPTVFTSSDESERITVAEEKRYYWRVRATTTNPGEWSNVAGSYFFFDRLGDVIYVHCAHDDTTGCSNSNRVGNQSTPFRSVQVAVDRAASVGASEVRVADRGSGAGYLGTVVVPNGIDLKGGYDSTFNEALRSFAT